MMRLNKLGYQQLIDEDIAWLETMPRTLERDHIIAVLKASVEHEYPTPQVVRWEDEEKANYGVDGLREEFRQRLYGEQEEQGDNDTLTIQNRKGRCSI